MDKLVLGRFSYLNCAPIYYALEKGKIKNDISFKIISETPAKLNQLFKKGSLDISPISSAIYPDLANSCFILPDLSISAFKRVESVILFSFTSIEKLDREDILISSHSESAASLLKILVKLYFKIKPNFIKNESLSAKAKLIIGDEALKLKLKKLYPYEYDLAEIWYKWTNLPFVFGLFVVRKEIFESNEEKMRKIWKMLMASKSWGLKNLKAIAKDYKNFGIDLINYWKLLNYDLSSLHKESLKLFFSYLFKIKEIKGLPEKIYIVEFP